ncbi:MAG: hypothetical protein HOQ05_08120 [Corynebacteriales bacterium]|nr:hypothetical protein [Mycobacteriales bacterium]
MRITITALATALVASVAVIGQSQPAVAATVNCTDPSVVMYHVDGNSHLRRWNHPAPLYGDPNWSQGQIAERWDAASTFSGGQGVLYTRTSAGDLVWHQDNEVSGGNTNWHPSSGTVIGTGWSEFSFVFSAGAGIIYAIDAAGNLYWYHHVGQNGEPRWSPESGRAIGSGFSFSLVASGGNGIMYAVTPDGELNWYRHLEPEMGQATWANNGQGLTVGSGWGEFTQLGSFGGGVILGRDSSGALTWYRHLEPLTGSAEWAKNGQGASQGAGWNNTSIVANVTGCVAAP